jgi:hypothetical protein
MGLAELISGKEIRGFYLWIGGKGARIFEIWFCKNGKGPGLLFSTAFEVNFSGDRCEGC